MQARLILLLLACCGEIEQVPPQFSAVKIDGERAYKRARDGEEMEIKSRIVKIETLELVESTEDTATFEATLKNSMVNFSQQEPRLMTFWKCPLPKSKFIAYALVMQSCCEVVMQLQNSFV